MMKGRRVVIGLVKPVHDKGTKELKRRATTVCKFLTCTVEPSAGA